MRYIDSDRYFTDHESDRASFKAWVFGKLAARVAPQLEAYWSDLYYDAQWINETVLSENVKVGEPITFFFSYNNMGTNISRDPWSGLYRENRLLVRITVTEDNRYHLRIGEL